MKAVLVVFFTLVLSCLAFQTTINKTDSSTDEPSTSRLALQFASTFLKVSSAIVVWYIWGLAKKNKSFKTVSFASPGKLVGQEELDPELWYIHGKAYDLKNFMLRHPGGYRPLMIARGRDCTELFESYHSLTDKPRDVLKKFAVPEKDLKDYVGMFNWDPESPVNAFQTELRKRVREHIVKNKIDTMCPIPNMTASLVWTIFTCWATYKFYWEGVWWSSIVVPAMWWLSFVQTFHDATHFAMSRNEIINSFWVYLYPYFSSPTTWDHQHVIGHHIFTNIFKKDPDLNHGMPIFRMHPGFRYRIWMRFQILWVWVIWFISTFWLSFVYDWTGISTGKYHGVLEYTKLSKARLAMHLLGRSISVFLTIGIPFTLFPFWKALWWSVSFYSVWGFFFMLITQVNHVVEDCLQGAGEQHACWSIHQVKTSHDYSHNSLFWYLISGGLNLQIEHHLFPGINQNHLTGIIPIVKELCKKHNIEYNYSATYTEAILKYIEVVMNGSKREAKIKKKD